MRTFYRLKLSAICGVLAATLGSHQSTVAAKFSVPPLREFNLTSIELNSLKDISSRLHRFNEPLLQRDNITEATLDNNATFSIDGVLTSDSINSKSEPELESNPPLKLEKDKSNSQPKNSDSRFAPPPDWAFQSILLLAKRSQCLEKYPLGLERIQNGLATRNLLAIAINTCLHETNNCMISKEDREIVSALEEEVALELKPYRDIGLSTRTLTAPEMLFTTTTKLSNSTITPVKPEVSKETKECH